MPRQPDTADRILDVATGLVQARGYNGFAYKDIAAALDIRNASIHFHFPTKADLGAAVAKRYRERFVAALNDIDSKVPAAADRLQGIADVFAATLRQEGRMCLCGMLGAEMLTLPPSVQGEAKAFFIDTMAWLARVLNEGRDRGELAFDGPAAVQAAMLLALLEGAMVVARGLGTADRFTDVVGAATAALRRAA